MRHTRRVLVLAAFATVLHGRKQCESGPGSREPRINPLERFRNGQWENGIAWFVVDGEGVSFPLAPGDSLQAFPLSFGYVENQPGTYRFVFEVALDSLGINVLDYSLTRSAPFELRP